MSNPIVPGRFYSITAQWRRFGYTACLPDGTAERRHTEWERGPFTGTVETGARIAEMLCGDVTLVQNDPERAPVFVRSDAPADWMRSAVQPTEPMHVPPRVCK